MSYKQLGDFSNIKGGKRLPKGQMLVATPTNHPYIRVRDLGKSKTLELDSSFEYIEQETFEKIARYIVNENDIIISIVGTIGLIGKVGSTLDGANLTENCAKIVDVEGFDKDFLYYYLTSNEGQSAIHAYTVGAVQQKLPLKNIIELMIPDIPLENQKKIAKTLSVFDDRIAENKKINHHLVELARSFWQERFSSKQPNGKLGDIIELFDSKRVPLSANQREKMDKTYPYYGATSLMDYVDDYLFDGTYLLLGEDGTVIDKEGYPILQYVWGKFWVNNHAHIMVGKNGFTVESLFVLLKNTCVSSIVTGAVQLKINQANLKSVDVYIPQKEELDNFNSTIEPIFDQLRNLYDEIKSLTTLRDALLPKLMSGEISVAD
ncbi:MAG: restriction endonuclease subunit S [Streptococcus gordonii]|nr:restriction endonuclease subunit S [Streptococcus gordonii]